MGLSRQEHWSGLPYLPALDLPNPGIEPTSLRSPALGGVFFTSSAPGKPEGRHYCFLKEEAEKATQVFTWLVAAAAAAKSLQSCPTLCDPIDGSPPGSPIPGILQARTLEWVAMSFSNAGKWKVKVKSLSRVRLFATPWTAAYQVPPSMGFSRQEYWSGVPSPSPTWLVEGESKLVQMLSNSRTAPIDKITPSVKKRPMTLNWTEHNFTT